jgi:hypothetical protein
MKIGVMANKNETTRGPDLIDYRAPTGAGACLHLRTCADMCGRMLAGASGLCRESPGFAGQLPDN